MSATTRTSRANRSLRRRLDAVEVSHGGGSPYVAHGMVGMVPSSTILYIHRRRTICATNFFVFYCTYPLFSSTALIILWYTIVWYHTIPHHHTDISMHAQLMEILSDESHADIISWLPHGTGFQIHKKKTFAAGAYA